eukprot:COSAG06_NODE_1452_length_9430_cov_3.275426_3_plen_51_part_00
MPAVRSREGADPWTHEGKQLYGGTQHVPPLFVSSQLIPQRSDPSAVFAAG